MTGSEIMFRYLANFAVAVDLYHGLDRFIRATIPTPDVTLSEEDGKTVFERIHSVLLAINRAKQDADEIILNDAEGPETMPASIQELVYNTSNDLGEIEDRVRWLSNGINDIIWRSRNGFIDQLVSDIRATASMYGEDTGYEDMPTEGDSVDESPLDSEGLWEGTETDEIAEADPVDDYPDAGASDVEASADSGSAEPSDAGSANSMGLDEEEPTCIPDETEESEVNLPTTPIYTQEELDRLIEEKVAEAIARTTAELTANQPTPQPEEAGTKITKTQGEPPKKSSRRGLRRKKADEEAGQ